MVGGSSFFTISGHFRPRQVISVAVQSLQWVPALIPADKTTTGLVAVCGATVWDEQYQNQAGKQTLTSSFFVGNRWRF